MLKTTAVVVLLALTAGAATATPLPQAPDGQTIQPTVSYGYQWFATSGEAMQIRVPARGKRRATLRVGGPMGEPATAPSSSYFGNMDPGSGGIFDIDTGVPCGSGTYHYFALDPWGQYRYGSGWYCG